MGSCGEVSPEILVEVLIVSGPVGAGEASDILWLGSSGGGAPPDGPG